MLPLFWESKLHGRHLFCYTFCIAYYRNDTLEYRSQDWEKRKVLSLCQRASAPGATWFGYSCCGCFIAALGHRTKVNLRNQATFYLWTALSPFNEIFSWKIACPKRHSLLFDLSRHLSFPLPIAALFSFVTFGWADSELRCLKFAVKDRNEEIRVSGEISVFCQKLVVLSDITGGVCQSVNGCAFILQF